jgi:hypothetical protein
VTLVADVPLRGAGDEPVDFARTVASHGVTELPPNRLDLEARVLEATLPIPRGARTIQLTERRGKLRIDALAGSVGKRARDALTTTVAHMFRLDENLLDFYNLVKEDGALSWCANSTPIRISSGPSDLGTAVRRARIAGRAAFDPSAPKRVLIAPPPAE